VDHTLEPIAMPRKQVPRRLLVTTGRPLQEVFCFL
jgi:hypothetical protein